MKELSLITLVNIKKLFNWRNIIMFLIILVCTWTAYYGFKLISDMTNASGSDYLIKIQRWKFIIIFINLYLNLFLTYSYVFLKENNISLTKEHSRKNSISNLIIIGSLFILFYITFYTIFFLTFKDIKWSTHGYVLDSYKAVNTLFFMFLFFNIITILFIGLISTALKFKYLLLIFVIILNIVFFIYIWKIFIGFDSEQSLIKFKNIFLIESIIVSGLFLINIIKRYLIYKNYFRKII